MQASLREQGVHQEGRRHCQLPVQCVNKDPMRIRGKPAHRVLLFRSQTAEVHILSIFTTGCAFSSSPHIHSQCTTTILT